MRNSLLVALPLAAALAMPSVVLAAPSAEQEARALFKEGNRLRDAKDYTGALEMYAAAYAKTPNPKILVNIGSVQALIGKNADAAETYEKFLRDAPKDDPLRATVTEALASVDKQLGKVIVDTAAGARISMDGKEVGIAPLPGAFRGDPGERTIHVEKQGMVPVDKKVTLAAGKTVLVDIDLVPSKIAEPDWNAQDPKKDPKKEPKKPDEVKPPKKVAVKSDPDGDPDGAIVDGVEPGGATRKDGGLGFLARAHFDANEMGRGAAGQVGVSYAFGRIELVAAAMLGPRMGGYLGANAYLTRGKIKPVVSAGGLFFSLDDGMTPGVRGAAGVAWSVSRRIAFVLDLGVELYPSAPENYESTVFVPSIGVLARL